MKNSRNVLTFNGINASTGKPLTSPMRAENVVRLARGEEWDLDHLKELKVWSELSQEDPMDVLYGINPTRLDESGWGVIFPSSCAMEIRKALAPLLRHRQAQATRLKSSLYQELAYQPRESKSNFLARYGAGPGPVDPEVIPYYLLIVGSPEEIPFKFQYQLDVQYAVGRIHFDTEEEYACYAESVISAESRHSTISRSACFFGVANPHDRATERSLNKLVEPLAEYLKNRWEGWSFRKLAEESAKKSNLQDVFDSGNKPAFLFTASHGVGFNPGDPLQREHQGALLCQDWPGCVNWEGPVSRDFYFSAEDISDRADVSGMITFHFACYGAGTPRYDSFHHRRRKRQEISPKNFVSRLPQRLLAHPRGGALATVAHVDRAWGYSFNWLREGSQLQVFKSTLDRLLDGYPVGAAMECFNQRYAELSSDLASEIEEMDYVERPDFMSIAGIWTANNDARSYVIVGDPAVSLKRFICAA